MGATTGQVGLPEHGLEPQLVVALASAAVGQGVGLLFPGHVDAFPGYQRPGHGGADHVPLVHGVRLDHGEDVIADELVLRVDGVVLVGDQLRLLRGGLDLRSRLSHVHRHRHDLVEPVVLAQQWYADRGVQPAGISQYDFLDHRPHNNSVNIVREDKTLGIGHRGHGGHGGHEEAVHRPWPGADIKDDDG